MIVNCEWPYDFKTQKFIPPNIIYWTYLDMAYYGAYEDFTKYPVLWIK
jgi:hypothetical protein